MDKTYDNIKILYGEEKKQLRDEIANKTLTEAVEQLDKFGKVIVVRPTGFGKSYMLAKLTSLYKEKTGKRSMYIYPTNVIRDDIKEKYGEESKSDVKLVNTDFISYKKLNMLNASGELKSMIDNYSIIMLDECHMAGADGFLKLYNETLKDKVGKDKIHMIGVTATPERQSKSTTAEGEREIVDIVEKIFDNHSVFTFGLSACIDKGLMQRLLYVCNTIDKQAFNRDVLSKMYKRLNSKEMKKASKASDMIEKERNRCIDVLKDRLDQMKDIDKVIKDTIVNEKGTNIRYLKFIVFCRNIEDISIKRGMVTNWFESAFPNLNINEVEIHSGESNDVEVSDIKYIKTLCERDGVIDLIYCVDMLNMGYHEDDIDGIVMVRTTSSDIIYFQQIGRCISINSDKRPIVFDFVSNLDKRLINRNRKEETKGNIIDRETKTVGTSEKGVVDISGLFEIKDETSKFIDNLDKEIETLTDTNKLREEIVVRLYTEYKAPVYAILSSMGYKINETNILAVYDILCRNSVNIEDEAPAIDMIKSVASLKPYFSKKITSGVYSDYTEMRGI